MPTREITPKRRKSRTPFPARRLFDMDRDFGSLLEDWENFRLPSLFAPEAEGVYPACDLSETKDAYIMRFDVPGVDKDDIHIELDGNRLTVSGERTEEHEEKDEKQYVSEMSYGEFARSFTLPEQVDVDQVNADFKNGVLKVTIPKSEKRKKKEIEIH